MASVPALAVAPAETVAPAPVAVEVPAAVPVSFPPLPVPLEEPAPAQPPSTPTLGRMDFLLGFVYTREPEAIDPLTALSGLDKAMCDVLHNHGIYTFKQIAAWTTAQTEVFGQRLGIGSRIRDERWPEQAKNLHRQLHGEKL